MQRFKKEHQSSKKYNRNVCVHTLPHAQVFFFLTSHAQVKRWRIFFLEKKNFESFFFFELVESIIMSHASFC